LPFSQLYHASNQQRRSIESCSQLHLGLKLVNYRLNLIMGGNSRDETSKPPGNESGETSSSGHGKFSVGEPAAEYAVQSADLISELRRKRAEILGIAKRHGARNVRVFGSFARGDARPNSDLDLLVEAAPKHSPFFPAGLIADLEEMLGRKVEVVEPEGLHWYVRDRVLKEAVLL
jgi:predicted nucleotidyltransferase